MRFAYDSTDASKIPANAVMVAGYVDGKYAWTDAEWGLFPAAVKVRIAVLPGTDDGQVLDVEQGNAMPPDVPGWLRLRRAAGQDPTVYTNRSLWPQVQAACQAAGEPEPHYWIATWDNVPQLLPGTVAVQYEPAGPYDLSVVADYWPGVDAPEQAPSAPADAIPGLIAEVQDVLGRLKAAARALDPEPAPPV